MTQWMNQRRSLLGAAVGSITWGAMAQGAPAPAVARPAPDQAMAQRIVRTLALAVAQQRVVGAVVLVARDGQTVY